MDVSRFSHAAIAERVRHLVARQMPAGCDIASCHDDLSLGASGVGLDSVAMVELVLACEREFTVRLPSDVIEATALTIESLTVAIERALPRAMRGPGV